MKCSHLQSDDQRDVVHGRVHDDVDDWSVMVLEENKELVKCFGMEKKYRYI